MAVSAASTVGNASPANVAGATKVAITGASANADAATTTVSTRVKVVAATTAAIVIVAVSVGVTTAVSSERAPALTLAPTFTPLCPEIPVDTMARIKLSFTRDSNSLAADISGGISNWSELGSQIVQVYNDVSNNCHETYQRRMLNCSFEFYEYNSGGNDMIVTYWKPWLTCNNSCPIEDPLFGIDNTDFISRMLQDFDPNQVSPSSEIPDTTQNDFPGTTPPSSAEPSEAPSSAPTASPKVPVSRKEFLEKIGASSVDPSTRTVFMYPTVTPSTVPTFDEPFNDS